MPRPRFRHPLAVALALLVVALRSALQPWLGDHAPLMILLLAPVLAALYGGLGPGLLATVVAGFAGVSLFVAPGGLPVPPNGTEWLRLGLFLGIGGTISWVIAGRTRALERLAAEHARLVDTQRELEARERRVRAIIEGAPSAMLLLDAGGRIVFANGEAERLFGWSREEFAARTIEDLIPERFRSGHGGLRAGFLRAPETRAMGGGRDLYALRRDGTEVAVEIGLNRLPDADGGALVLASITDITERKRAEQALRTSEERYALAARATSNAIWDWDLATDGLQWNEGVHEVFGHPAGAVPDGIQWWYEAIHPDDRERVLTSIHAAIARASAGESLTWREEYRFRRGDGGYACVIDRGFVARGADGRAVRMIGAMADVTREREATAQLQRREAHLAAIHRQTGAGFAEVDLDGRFVDVNERFCELLGRDAPGLLGMRVEDVTHPEDWPANLPLLERLVRDGVPFQIEKRYLRPDGSTVWVTNSVTRLHTEGARDRVLGVAIDITARKDAEARLRESEARLREADQRKDEFLATLAHELRNPLAPLSNSLRILERMPDPAAAAPIRAMMQRQLGQLVRLVDDLLEVSRITTGKLQLQRTRLELRQVLNAAFEGARPQVEAHRHRLVVERPEHEVWLDGDPVRLAQVFTNLLNNAAKYTEPGGLIVLRAEVPTPGRLRICVRDTGVGLDPASLERVFDLFAQVDHAHGRSQGGLGIGLSLARRLVEMHGGTLAAHSEGLGRGATFTVELPASVPAAAAAELRPARVAADPSKCHVVIADDNRDAADSLAMMLALGGHEVRTAYDGREALQVVRAHRPQVAILDIGMPECDGYGVARALRGEAWGRELVLIALTGWGQEADRRRAAEAGFDHHFTKPVDPARIERMLGELPHCGRPRTAQA